MNLVQGTNIVKIWLSLCLEGSVMFARHCGNMYSGHLFSYGGFLLLSKNSKPIYSTEHHNSDNDHLLVTQQAVGFYNAERERNHCEQPFVPMS